MPRRKEPTREVSIHISDENVRDALTLWVKKYHGVNLDIKQIELQLTNGKVSATATHKPVEIKPEVLTDELIPEEPRPF